MITDANNGWSEEALIETAARMNLLTDEALDDWRLLLRANERHEARDAYTQAVLSRLASLSTANNTQVGGSHYQGRIQTWDYIIAQDLGYLEGNIVKYVSRWKKKNGLEDLEKARHYLDKLIETAKEGTK